MIRTLTSVPDLLALAETQPQRYPYFLQSIAQSNEEVHYDLLFAFPQYQLSLQPDLSLAVENFNDTQSREFRPDTSETNRFLDALDLHWRHHAGTSPDRQLLPFEGGWFIYLGYELAQEIEPGLKLPRDGAGDTPIAIASRIPAAIVVNHADNKAYVVCEPGFEPLLDRILEDIKNCSTVDRNRAGTNNTNTLNIDALIEEPGQHYIEQVKKIKHYIREGDVFQVNLSRRWQGLVGREVSAPAIYRRLCETNPAPFSCLAQFGDFSIMSSSPERLVKVTGKNIETRPIAGTRPRGETSEDDESKLKELIAHPKERAEHIMLIDLERNDLGRVCEPGSVEVNELMVLESYAHVHHIVSNVRGRLRNDCAPGEIIAAVFPGGTITGCPKVRCMEIIAELEQQARGAYTGSVGYINHNGNMDLNILIRTMTLSGNNLSLRAGAGIVADSNPEKELMETRAKAKGMLLALE